MANMVLREIDGDRLAGVLGSHGNEALLPPSPRSHKPGSCN